jgi:uncharacterized protein YndB with AHSA1/START domain
MPAPIEVIADPNKPTIEFRRAFDAPRELVWKVLTSNEHIKHWYGPRTMTYVSSEMDLRVGGAWRIVLRGGDGNDYSWSGEYRVLREPELIEQTWWFEQIPEARTIERLTLEAQGNRTVVHGLVTHKTIETRDFHVKAMRPGFDETWDRFAEVLAQSMHR